MAALIATNLGYILFTFLPPVLWLLFYLKEDRHPEPKKLLLLTFWGGMVSAFLAAETEIFIFRTLGWGSFMSLEKNSFLLFLIIGFVEEYAKYLAVKFLILKRKDFDEPIDAMIYMMTSALGFAALENALFLLPVLRQNLLAGVEFATNRFLGANLLHALSSGIVGFFLARSFFSPWRKHFVALGVILASLLHAAFNYFILIREAVEEGTFYLILLLVVMAVMVFIDFEKLKGQAQPPPAQSQ